MNFNESWRRWLHIVPKSDSEARDGTPNTRPFLPDAEEAARTFPRPSAPRRKVTILPAHTLHERRNANFNPLQMSRAGAYLEGADAPPVRIPFMWFPAVLGLAGLKQRGHTDSYDSFRTLNLKPPLIPKNTQLARRTLSANYTEPRGNDLSTVPGVFVGAQPR